MEDMEQKTGIGDILTREEVDTIGEILNISMGSASTAISALLDRQVVITPPKVTLQVLESLDYGELEPAILVKIQYVEGISGSNVMLFRQRDMQIILNLLMGTDDPPRDDFEFDEISMSAACEVMNQMMGASATALSQILSTTVNISTPEAHVITTQKLDEFVDVPMNQEVVAISFGMEITDVMNTSFASVMPSGLAHDLIQKVMGDQAAAIDAMPAPAEPAPAPAPPAAAPAPAAPAAAPAQPAPPAYPAPAEAVPPGYPPMPPQGMPQQGMPPQGMPQQGMPQQGQAGYPYPYPYPPMPGYPYPYPPMPGMQGGAPGGPDGGMYTEMGVIRQPMNVQAAQFPSFSTGAAASPSSSMDLLMNVSLNVSVEIGKTKRKIKDIMEFGQGTVLELEKQAGAPVEIIVNGQPIARGDVVVIEDNFGVRITEILGMKDLIESLGNNKV